MQGLARFLKEPVVKKVHVHERRDMESFGKLEVFARTLVRFLLHAQNVGVAFAPGCVGDLSHDIFHPGVSSIVTIIEGNRVEAVTVVTQVG